MNTDIHNMIQMAHDNLEKAYAPYSNFQVSCCIKTSSNHIYSGVNFENNAFGMSVCAEASAIAQMIIHGEQEITEMVILAKTGEICAPCGACRQRIIEFSNKKTMVYMCNHDGILAQATALDLLPMPFHFNPKHRKDND
jgi:cytidine deaminase